MNILLINGANLNMLGVREPEKYGAKTLADIENSVINRGKELGVEVDVYQSNIEGEIVEKIQQARGKYNGILINAGGYTHTSVVIRDAISAVQIPTIEVHMTNIHAREEFRHTSLLSGVCKAIVAGFGDNILAEEKYEAKIKVDNKVVQNNSRYPFTLLYDGEANGPTDSCWMASQKRFTKLDDGYLDICFDLGRTYKINKFFINHLEGYSLTNYGLATGRYEIYAGSGGNFRHSDCKTISQDEKQKIADFFSTRLLKIYFEDTRSYDNST